MSRKKSYITFLIILVVTSGGGLNQLNQLSMYPLYKALSNHLSINAHIYQHIIGLYFIAAFFGSLSISLTNRYGSLILKYIIGLSICFIGALISWFSSNASIFSIGRLFIGFGSGMIYVVSMTLVMEIGKQELQIKLFGILDIFVSATLLLSVTSFVFFSSSMTTVYLSTYVTKHLSWRNVFTVLCFFHIFYMLSAIVVSKEVNKRTADSPQYRLKEIITLILKNKTLLIYILAIGFYMLGNIIYLVSSPIYFIDTCHLSSEFFSHIFIITIFAAIAGSMSITLIKLPKNIKRLTFWGLTLIVLNVSVLFLLSVFKIEKWYIYLTSYIITNFFFAFCQPMIYQLMLTSGGKAYKISASINQSFAYLVCWIGAVKAALIPENTLVYPSAFILVAYMIGLTLFCVAAKPNKAPLEA